MPRVGHNAAGFCPYCGDNKYQDSKTESRNSDQDLMFCAGCDRWSVRKLGTRVQYPLTVPEDKETGPVTSVWIE